MMLIRYSVKEKEFANRTRSIVPRKGDFIKFSDGTYEVNMVLWAEDGERGEVRIHLAEPFQ